MILTISRCLAVLVVLLVTLTSTTTNAFAPTNTFVTTRLQSATASTPATTISTALATKKIADKRRKQLGIADDEDEYDLDFALDNNTDPFITKVIAGSLILSITALLIYAIVIPATTDYGEGVCNALLTGGRC